jgi:hypothetical protein
MDEGFPKTKRKIGGAEIRGLFITNMELINT